MNNNARATKQPCNVFYSVSGGQHADSPVTLILTLTWLHHNIIKECCSLILCVLTKRLPDDVFSYSNLLTCKLPDNKIQLHVL